MAENQAKTSGNIPAQTQQRSTAQQTTGQQPAGQQVSTRSQPGGLSPWQDPFFVSPREFFSSNPFTLMRRMNEEMDRVFGDFGFSRSQGESGIWSPAIEVSERDGNYIVHAELPGLRPEDVKVEVAEDSLVIQGERKSTQEENQGGIRRSERRYGQFYRRIPLPEGVNPEQVRAKFENGVLEVVTPVPQQQNRARQIPIEGGTGSSATQTTQAGTEHKAAKAGA